MKKLLALLFCSCFYYTPAEAQLLLLNVGPGTLTTAGGGYTGPGDLQTFAMYWGLQAYSSATRGTAVINLCNVSDVACADVSTDATTGLIPNAPVIGGVTCGTSVGVDVCTVKIFYDLSGNSFTQTQATIGSRAVFLPSCTGLAASQPCAVFSGGQAYETVGNYVRAVPITTVGAFKRTGAFTSFQGTIAFQNQDIEMAYLNSTNTIFGFAGAALSQAATDSVWHTLQVVFNGASSIIGTDATQSTGDTGATATSSSGQVWLGAVTTGANKMTANFVEGGVLSSGLSSGSLTALQSNIKSREGF